MAELADLRNVVAAARLGSADDDAAAAARSAARRPLRRVQRISHEMFVSDETGRLIEAAPAVSTAPIRTPTTPRWSG